MKNKKLFVLSSLALVGLMASCEISISISFEESSSEESSSSLPVQNVVLNDTRTDAFVTVFGEMNGTTFESYDDDKTFKSLYEAVQACLEEGEAGSYVYRKDGDPTLPAFTKVARSDDYWFYYVDGNVAEGYSPWENGDTEWYIGENVTRIESHSGYPCPTYQPYKLMGHESGSTQSWNRLYFLDAAVRYNPKAFTGIQDTTYTFELSKAKIRPSYNEAQKAQPMITLSTTDSYNWSNQGIYMDTDTGYWYYIVGETQSDIKDLEGEDKPKVLMTSTWDQEAQEWTPDNDVKFTFATIWNEEEEYVSNSLKIEILDGATVKNTYDYSYEQNTMTMRGTHRAQAALDLVPTDEDAEEQNMTPDFMCGAYFKNIIVSEGKGSVRADLTDDEYEGDDDMCCEPGETYDLLYAKGGYENDSDTEVILDNVSAISYDESNTGKDTWNISFEQKIPTIDRSETITKAEKLIKDIPAGAVWSNEKVQKAYRTYKNLTSDQKYLISEIDGFNALQALIDAQN